jgi:hypothetical protein
MESARWLEVTTISVSSTGVSCSGLRHGWGLKLSLGSDWIQMGWAFRGTRRVIPFFGQVEYARLMIAGFSIELMSTLFVRIA